MIDAHALPAAKEQASNPADSALSQSADGQFSSVTESGSQASARQHDLAFDKGRYYVIEKAK